MRYILIMVCASLYSCTTIQIGDVTIKTPRKLCLIHEGTTICTSEMLLDQQSVRAITNEVGEVTRGSE